MTALFYIYRNLHRKDVFSVRYRGRVIDRPTHFVAHEVAFKVNEAGRLRTLKEGRKNVHAFVVAKSYHLTTLSAASLQKVCYNPFRLGAFTIEGSVIQTATSVLFSGGWCYLLEADGQQHSSDVWAE